MSRSTPCPDCGDPGCCGETTQPDAMAQAQDTIRSVVRYVGAAVAEGRTVTATEVAEVLTPTHPWLDGAMVAEILRGLYGPPVNEREVSSQ